MICPDSERLQLDSRADHGDVEIFGRGFIDTGLRCGDLAILDVIQEELKLEKEVAHHVVRSGIVEHTSVKSYVLIPIIFASSSMRH